MIGRVLALAKNKCPIDIFGKDKKFKGRVMWCADCPDGCPLNNKFDSRNDPERHPEDFINEYSYMYPLEGVDDNILEYCVGPERYGYYLKEEPEHWREFCELINSYKGEK